MSTTAPPPPDTLTVEETELLRRLDPDSEQPCAAPDCDATATHRWTCVSCGGGGLLCSPHTARSVVQFQQQASAHASISCAFCSFTFCAHEWPRFVQVLPIGDAA